MSDSELQSADEAVEPVEGSDSAPDSEGQHEEKVTFSEEQQAKVNEIVAEQTFKRRQTERELQEQLEAERKRREELETQVAPQSRPEIPPIPDPDDFYGDQEGFREAIAARDQAIERATAFDAQSTRETERENARIEEQNLQAAKALEDRASTYVSRAKALGVSEEQLAQAGGVVRTFLTDEHAGIANFILDDDQGPLITRYLARNPQELELITRMDPMKAAVHLATEVKSKIGAQKTTTDAPEPPDLLKGGGSPSQKRGPSGLTIE